MLKKILNISYWVGGLAIAFVVLAAAIVKNDEVRLSQLKVKINYQGEHFFIDEEEVSEAVYDMGIREHISHMDTINPAKIEYMLENNPFVHRAEVYKELDGKLHVDVTVRQPILRVFSTNGQSLYIDEEGKFMPLSSKFTSRVPLVNGALSFDARDLVNKTLAECTSERPEDLTLMRIAEVFSIAQFFNTDPFYTAQFNQMYVAGDGEIELIPRVGDHRVIVGSADRIESKMTKLQLFYKKGLSKTGWNEYSVINLKYKDQVVCTKNRI